MIDMKERKTTRESPEDVKEILETVSKEVPALIKNIIESVFSEEAGRNMGKAAAAFYKELKNSGMPEEMAVKMTENYISVFTGLGDILKRASSTGKSEKEINEAVSKAVKKKLAKYELDEEAEEHESAGEE